MFVRLKNYQNLSGILIDNLADTYSKSIKAAKIVVLEDHLIMNNGGQFYSLPEKGLSQLQATNQAHKILQNLYSSGSMKVYNNPWLEILAPQLILYFVSKLLRMLHILRQLPSDISWKIYSTNGMLASLAIGIFPDCTHSYRSIFSRRGIKDYIYYNFPEILLKNRLIHLKINKNDEFQQSQIKKNGVLFWSTNIVHETVSCEIIELLVSDNIPSYCVVSRKINSPFIISQSVFRDRLWKQQLKKTIPGLRIFLDNLAEYIVQDLVIEGMSSSKPAMVRFLRSKLEVFFVPQAAIALVEAQRTLDLMEPQAVFIKDIGDFRTRALAISARKRKIPIYHHQFGTATPDNIEWKWDIADKHLVWGEWSREVITSIGVPLQKIHITGTPNLSSPKVTQERKLRRTNIPARALFTLMPESPMTFGNGGALSLSECHGVMKMLFRWIELMEGRVILQIKPRPLRDHPWFDSFSTDLPKNVEILSHDLSVSDALNNTDLLITTHSTMAIDAITMYKPMVFIDWGYKPHPFKEAVQFGAAEIADTPKVMKKITEKLLFDINCRNNMICKQMEYRSRISKYTGEDSVRQIAEILKDGN